MMYIRDDIYAKFPNIYAYVHTLKISEHVQKKIRIFIICGDLMSAFDMLQIQVYFYDKRDRLKCAGFFLENFSLWRVFSL